MAYVHCPLGHYTHQFLRYDVRTFCWYSDLTSYVSSPTLLSSSFPCRDQTERVSYSLVCDHRDDCRDGSDEDFCSYLTCKATEFTCYNRQCIPQTKICDGWKDCQNSEDEKQCRMNSRSRSKYYIPPPAIVDLTEHGILSVMPLRYSSSASYDTICPNTHFQCLDNGYCLPVFLRCNGVYDCPGYEDEAECDSCPGFYRCRASHVCLDHSRMCDGHGHCPQHDDELMCDLACPSVCTCRGLAFFCRHNFTASAYPFLRFLDASGSAMKPAHLRGNRLLIHLNLANCGLVHLDDLVLPNLQSLDVRDNKLNVLSHLVVVPQLRELSLAGNPLVLFNGVFKGLPSFHQVLKLDLSRMALHVLNVTSFASFPSLQVLNLSHSGVQRIQGEGFSILEQLRVVYLQGCPMTWFPRKLFRSLSHLQTVHAHSFKMCCPEVLPVNFNLHNCFAPSDEISSCDDLLRGNGYKVCAFILSFLAVVGNAVSFIFRICFSKQENKRGYGNFVTYLSVSDFLMGIYLAIITAADQVYHGSYVWNDVVWRHSVTCKLAGFLSLLSSEVSVLIICLITVDRFLVLRFPFRRLHFKPSSAHLASVVIWISGVLMASIPLLPMTSHWEFYSQNGICIPLPITRTYFSGYNYSFCIFIVFNFIMFVVISIGQLSIYWSIRANSMSVCNKTKKNDDLSIARRLIIVAMSDFLCWFPVCVLGLMAFNDVPIPGEVNVIVAIFVLPLNSAVNPCLYSFGVIMERRRRARAENLRKLVLTQLKAPLG